MDFLAALAAAWAAAIAPPQPGRTPLETAETLIMGDGPGEKKRMTLTPAVRAILGALMLTYQRIVIPGPVQDGKTYAAVVVPLVYAMTEGRFSVLLAGPRKEDVDALFLDKIRTTLERSGRADALPQEGAGSRRGVPDQLLCPLGCSVHLRGAGGANEAQMSGITVKWTILTEADGISLSTKGARRAQSQEGRRKVELFARRGSSWGRDKRLIIESTVKDDRQSLVLGFYAESTQGRLWHRCPRCGVWAPREWAQVQYDPTDHTSAGATATIGCPACLARLSPAEASESAAHAMAVHRGQSIANDQVVGPMPAGDTWGLRWTALDSASPSKALDILTQEHWAALHAANARGDWAPLKQFHRDQLVEPFTGDPAAVAAAKRCDTHAVAARSAHATYDRGTIPIPGTAALAVDMQEREAFAMVLVQDGERTAIVDWWEEYLCHKHETPTPEQRVAVLNRIRTRAERGWPSVATGEIIRPAVCGVDVGGRGWVQIVDDWLQADGYRWFALRGDGRRDVQPTEKQNRETAQGWWERFDRDDGRRLLMIDSATIKGRIMDGLAAPVDSPVALLVPRKVAADSWLARHLCAEERVAGPHGPVWVQTYARNDYLDTTCYGKGMAHYASEHLHAAADAVPVSV